MRGPKRAFLAILILALLLVACGTGEETTEPPAQPAATAAATVAVPVASATTPPTGEAADEPAPAQPTSPKAETAPPAEPDDQGDAPAPQPPSQPEEVSIETASGLTMAGTFYPGTGDGPWPGLLLLHINGGRRQDWQEVAPQMAEAGYAVLALDMPGFGETGGPVNWEQTPDDLQQAWAYLEGRQDVDGSRMAPIGASIGSTMALLTAVDNPDLKTAVLLSPGLNYFGISTGDAIVDYGQRPILIVASEEDRESADSSRQLQELALGEAQLVMYDGAGHGTRMFGPQPDLTGLIIDWLDQHVKGQSQAETGRAIEGASNPAELSIFDVDWDDRSLFAAGLTAAEVAVLNQLPGASIYHMDLTLSPDLLSVTGRQEVRYTNQEDVPLDELYFHLYPNLLGGNIEISDLAANGEVVEPIVASANSVMGVPLPSPLAPGEQVVIDMTYVIDVPAEGGSNYGVFATVDDVLALAHFYPQVAVYDDLGWDIGFPAQNADVTYADASFYLVRVNASAEQVIVASGVEVDNQSTPNEQVLTFAAGPARDFYLASSDRYEVTSQTVGETTINSYGFPEFAERNQQVLGYAGDAMEIFNDRIGPYPYTEFDVAPTPNLALGVEYPGVVVVTSRLYDPEVELSAGPSGFYIESTVAHEVGHQWFYNAVGNNQVKEPWIDESLTQYVTYLYYVDAYGQRNAEGFRDSFLSRWDRVAREEIPIGMPAGNYSGSEYSAIVYGRGPLFFEALAEKMGQETFDAFLRDYYRQNMWGLVDGQSLKTLAEAHCGCDLTALFEEWVGEIS